MHHKLSHTGPIGIFDSGLGGLTILRDIRRRLPQYDYLYLGDNARAPYGSRSFDVVYRFTLQAVRYLFQRGCPLVILACNTASAKALRTIQQNDLPLIDPTRRVLGIIRPTVERLGELSTGGHIGVLGTAGTVRSRSYDLEIAKLYPDFTTTSQACPMWVPIVENAEADKPGADYFVTKYTDQLMAQRPDIDTLPAALRQDPGRHPAGGQRGVSGRNSGRQPRRLSLAPPRNGVAPQARRPLPLPHHRELRGVLRTRLRVYGTENRRRTHRPVNRRRPSPHYNIINTIRI